MIKHGMRVHEFRLRSRKLWVSALPVIMLLAGVGLAAPAAAAAEVAGTPVVLGGGLVRAGSAAAQESIPAAGHPSCGSITYAGDAGYISVQERNGRLQWGITMTPLSYSIGTWSVST